MTNLPKLSQAQIEALKSAGHVVHVMPRKGMVRVDGFKLFRMGA